MSAAADQIGRMTREEVERTAAGVLRALASEAFQRHRNASTAAREASQLTHLAVRLDAFADEPEGKMRAER